MTYAVKEIFYTLQGEGLQAGRPAVFCRFAGCNLWNGREQDRPKAICQFCDTDFVGTNGTFGGQYKSADALAETILSTFANGAPGVRPFVVFTGGEPLLQLDDMLIEACHERRMTIAVETNGTISNPPAGIDWICVSPKAGAPLRLRRGDELKVIFPQPMLDMAHLASMEFKNLLVQPMDGQDLAANTAAAVDFCLANPAWRLSFQMHKHLGLR